MSLLDTVAANPFSSIDGLIAATRHLGDRRSLGRLLAVRAGVAGRNGFDHRPDLATAAETVLAAFGQFAPADATLAAVALAGAPRRAADVLSRLHPAYADPKAYGVPAATARRLRLIYNAACLLSGRVAQMSVPRGASSDPIIALRDGKVTGPRVAVSRDAGRVKRLRSRGDAMPEKHLPVDGLLIATVAAAFGLPVPVPNWRSAR